jgi:hypothetical protein
MSHQEKKHRCEVMDVLDYFNHATLHVHIKTSHWRS